MTLLVTLLGCCLGTLGGSPAVASTARTLDPGTATSEWPTSCSASAAGLSPVLRPGHDGEWIFETFLLDPDRHRVASGVFGSDSDPGRSGFWVCRSITRFGVSKIRAKLTTYDGDEHASTWIEPAYVRLRRWGR